MSQTPGNLINIFGDLKTEITGKVVEISFYAVRSGTMYVSFWKNVPTEAHTFEMVAKIEVLVKNSEINQVVSRIFFVYNRQQTHVIAKYISSSFKTLYIVGPMFDHSTILLS